MISQIYLKHIFVGCSRPDSPIDIEIPFEAETEDTIVEKNLIKQHGLKPIKITLEKIRDLEKYRKSSGRIDLGGLKSANPALFKACQLGSSSSRSGKSEVKKPEKRERKSNSVDSKKKEKKPASSSSSSSKGQEVKKKSEDVKPLPLPEEFRKKAEEKPKQNKMFSSSSDSDSDLEEIRKKVMKPSLFKPTSTSSSSGPKPDKKPEKKPEIKPSKKEVTY